MLVKLLIIILSFSLFSCGNSTDKKQEKTTTNKINSSLLELNLETAGSETPPSDVAGTDLTIGEQSHIIGQSYTLCRKEFDHKSFIYTQYASSGEVADKVILEKNCGLELKCLCDIKVLHKDQVTETYSVSLEDRSICAAKNSLIPSEHEGWRCNRYNNTRFPQKNYGDTSIDFGKPFSSPLLLGGIAIR